MTSKLVGGTIKGGAWAAATNETLSKEIRKLANGSPERAQFFAGVIGAFANLFFKDNIYSGAIIAQAGMKWNNLYDNNITEGEFYTLNDALYAVNVSNELELEHTEYNDFDYNTKMYTINSNWYEIADNASKILEADDNFALASMMFQHALHGNGEKQWFPEGTSAYNHLNTDEGLKAAVRNLGKNIPIGGTQSFYFSIQTKGTNNLAFGKIKIAANITHNADGSYYVFGQGKDVYNFENLKYYGNQLPVNSNEIIQNMKHGSVAYINNLAFILQKAGLLTPYIYGVRINTIIEG